MGLGQALRAEFRCQKSTLSHAGRQAFLEGQWKCQPAFILYRLAIAAYALFVLIYNFATSPTDHLGRSILVYLTVLTYTLLAAHLTLSAAIVVTGTCGSSSVNLEKRPEAYAKAAFEFASASAPSEQPANPRTCQSPWYEPLPWYMKMDWLLYNVVLSMSPIVTAVYFGALYRERQISDMENLVDFSMHATNTATILLEICLNRIPVRVMHCIYPLLYAFLYTVFNTIYWSIDPVHNVLYPYVLDWNHPETTVIAVAGVCVGLFILQILLFLCYRVRLSLSGASEADGPPVLSQTNDITLESKKELP